jgi:hypothetical protein
MNGERDLYLGIDPGQSGGLAILEEDGSVVLVEKMPETERDTAEILAEFVPRVRFALIEAVHSMPKQGVSSSFKFGRSYGFLRGLLIGLRLTFDEARPQEWQRGMSCLSGGDKNVTKAKAQQLFPELKITHATADCLLIAEFCRRTFGAGGRAV